MTRIVQSEASRTKGFADDVPTRPRGASGSFDEFGNNSEDTTMSSDFWAGYLSGAIGIIIGNPLDLIKVRLQASESTATAAVITSSSTYHRLTSLVKGLFPS
jgi:hypothetical protein